MKFLTRPAMMIFLTIVLIVSGLTVFGETKKEIKIMVYEDEEMNQIKANMPDIMHGKEFGMNMHMHMLLELTEGQEKKIHELQR